MKVGASFFFQNYFRAEKPDWEIYREDLELAEMVEPLGFDSIWGVEHHFSPYTMIPDVLQFLTFMAGRTRRVGFGSMVVVLPWHDPVRVAEQIAMLDNYCGDRDLVLGFGRGAGRIEYNGFRVPMSESRERFTEGAEIVRLALSQERFSYDGKYHHIPEMSIRPQPRHKNLTDRFYGAIISPETGDIMAKQGMGMLVIPQKSWAEHKKDYDHFKESCAKFGHKAKKPIVSTFIYCGETEKEAVEGAEKWIGNYADTAISHYEYDEPEHFRNAKGYEFHAKMADATKGNASSFRQMFTKTQVFGTPAQCVETLRTIASTMDAAEFVGTFKFGGMPLEVAQRSMKLFATEVLPHVQSKESRVQQSAAAGGGH
ncbi:MAG: LLM class flavin-dependent oxidoreductase [Candidatus Binatus sp.]|uniref:LLM class flavin-dependent oxidoreductase n=1 Tax=Candidatus Binatus sp. TaxID=2811406 RepID=UPI00271E16B4|nr:LLM class flavin-dependent oxidoreductase [Candidatus Binatus sp.]MDO8434382.1 LLM class flavin-dependent oxidoreductase [Candidatus Binatus sp.]